MRIDKMIPVKADRHQGPHAGINLSMWTLDN